MSPDRASVTARLDEAAPGIAPAGLRRVGLGAAAVALVVGVGVHSPFLLAAGMMPLVVWGIVGLRAQVIPPPQVVFETHPRHVTCGESVTARLTITSSVPRRPTSVWVVHGDGEIQASLPSLRAGVTEEVSVPVPTERRGVFSVGPIIGWFGDPFGIASTGPAVGVPSEYVVSPRTCLLTPFPAALIPDPDGRSTDRSVEGGIEFHAVREYQRGDALRLVVWKAVAKSPDPERMYVRQNLVMHSHRGLIVLDRRRSSYDSDDDFELAVEIAASLVLAAADGANADLVIADDSGVGELGEVSDELLAGRLAVVALVSDGPSLTDLTLSVSSIASFTAVVTGSAVDRHEVADVAAHRGRRRMILIHTGEPRRRRSDLPDVETFTARSLDDFEHDWNRRYPW